MVLFLMYPYSHYQIVTMAIKVMVMVTLQYMWHDWQNITKHCCLHSVTARIALHAYIHPVRLLLQKYSPLQQQAPGHLQGKLSHPVCQTFSCHLQWQENNRYAVSTFTSSYIASYSDNTKGSLLTCSRHESSMLLPSTTLVSLHH